MAFTDTQPVITTPTVAAVDDNRSYMDWPAIFAGTLLATAISLVLLTFGSAIGLSATSAFEGEGMSLMWFAIAAGLWLMWVQISAFVAGGYLTGRMRRRFHDASEHESDIRDGSHGLTVWAVGTLLGAFIAYAGISGAVSTAVTAAGTAAGAAVTAAGSAAEAIDPNALLIDRLMRPGASAPAADAAAGTQPAAPQAGAQGDMGESRGEIGRIIVSALGDGEIDEGDKQYLINSVAARAGIPPEEATQRVDQVIEQARQIEADARAAADQARRMGMIAAFLTAASLFISAVGAYYGATLGGNHRDKQTIFNDWNRIG